MGREQPDRRAAILEAAGAVIGERGLCDTRIADIAARAGVSAGLAVYYFESKDRLLAEALTFADNRFYEETMRELAELESCRERLLRLVARACPTLTEDADDGAWKLWIELWSRAQHDPEVRAQRELLGRRWRATIAEIVREGQAAAEFAPVDVDDLVVRLAALLDGLAIQVLLRDPEINAQRMWRVTGAMLSRELGFELTGEQPA